MTREKTILSFVFLSMVLSPLPLLSSQETQQQLTVDRNQVAELLLRSRDYARKVEDRMQHDVLMGDIAEELGKLGKTAEARETFPLIIGDRIRDGSLQSFLDDELAAEEFSEAQETIEAMTTPQGKAEALCALASALWSAGNRYAAKKTLDEAERIFAGNRKELTNSEFLIKLARTQEEMGEKSRASNTERELDQFSDRYTGGYRGTDEDEGRIATDQLPDNLVSGEDKNSRRDTFMRAEQEAESLSEGHRDFALKDIVIAQASAGFIEDSLQAAAKIKDVLLKWHALHAIALSQTQHISLEAGLKTAAQIQSEPEYELTLLEISQLLGRQNELREVYMVVELIHSPYLKSRAMVDAARAMCATAI